VARIAVWLAGLWAGALAAEGGYFSVPLPAGWAYDESDSGFVARAPRGGSAALRIELGGLGTMSVRGYLAATLWREGLGHARLLALRILPPLSGPAGQQWQSVEADYRFERNGKAYRLRALCAVLRSTGDAYTALVRTVAAPQVLWHEMEPPLLALHAGLTVVRPVALAGLSAAQLPAFHHWAEASVSADASSPSPSAR
jgi:hypothetical protein